MRYLTAAFVFSWCLAIAESGYASQDRPSPCLADPGRSVASGRVMVIGDRNPPCRIEFRETGIRLEAGADGERPDPGLTVVVDSNGRYYSANAPGWGPVISVWDSRGRYLSSFGGEGDGPGELSARGGLNLFIDGRDDLHVRDGSYRWSVFSPEQEFLRRVGSGVMGGLTWRTVILDDGSALASDGLVSPGYHFRVADSTGALASRFGPVEGRSSSGRQRPISHAGGDSFWAGPEHGVANVPYVLEEWGLDGTLRRSIRRDAEWYRWEGPIEHAPRVTQVHVDRGGLLYVVVWRPTEEYVREQEKRVRGRGPVDLRAVEREHERMDEMTELVLEVIDTRSGVLLASDRYVSSEARDLLPLGMFRGSLRGYRYKEDEAGLPYVEIVELALVARE